MTVCWLYRPTPTQQKEEKTFISTAHMLSFAGKGMQKEKKK